MSDISMNMVIHGAFRRDLDRFISALMRFSPGDRARARQLHTAWENFDAQLTHHHESEHDIVWPALESVGASRELLTAMDDEHETMAAALAETRTAMDALVADPTHEQSHATLGACRRLRTVTVAHLEHEEAETEELYRAKRDTPELKAMSKELAKGSPSEGGRFLAWLQDGASPAERAAIHHEVPAPVRVLVGGIFGRRYRRDVAPVWRS